MKKIVIITAATIMGLVTGCTKDEVTGTAARQINFKSFVGKSARGLDIQQAVDLNFGLFAYRGTEGVANGSSNYAITSNARIIGGKSYANPSDAIYWPDNGDLIGFYAYAPYAATGISNIAPIDKGTGVTTPPSFDFEVAAEVAEQVDLLAARSEKMAPVATVPLIFNHITTKVAVQAKTSAANWRVAVTDVKIAGVYYSGRYSFAVNQASDVIAIWNVQTGSTATYTAPLNIDGKATPTSPEPNDAVVITSDTYKPLTSTKDGDFLFLLPQTLPAEALLQITYNVYNNSSGSLIANSKTLSLNIGDTESLPNGANIWKPGNIMTYKINFAERPAGLPGSIITFEPSINDWNDNDSVNN